MTFAMFLLQFYNVSLANMFDFLTNYHHCHEWILTQTWVEIPTQWQLSDDKWFSWHNDTQHCISCSNMMTKWMNKMWFLLQSYFWLILRALLDFWLGLSTMLVCWLGDGRCLKHSKPLRETAVAVHEIVCISLTIGPRWTCSRLIGWKANTRWMRASDWSPNSFWFLPPGWNRLLL